MLLVFEGYFNEGRFITDTPYIPECKKTIVTILDEAIDKEKEKKAYQKLMDGIIDEIKTSDEILKGEPEKARFRTTGEMEAL